MPDVYDLEPHWLYFTSEPLDPELAARLRLGDPELFVCYPVPNEFIVGRLLPGLQHRAHIHAIPLVTLTLGEFRTYDQEAAPSHAIRAPRIYKIFVHWHPEPSCPPATP